MKRPPRLALGLPLALVATAAACRGQPAPTPPSPRAIALAVTDGGSEASPRPEALRERVPMLLYPPLACLDVRASPKARSMFAPLPCDEARRRREAYLAAIQATGELPRTFHAGATARIDGPGKVVDDDRVQLSANGAAGALVVHVDLEGKVRSVIAGAFAPTIHRFDAQRSALEVVLPSNLNPHNGKVTDVFDRDLTIAARFEGAAIGEDEIFRGDVTTPGATDEMAAPRSAWMGTELPASKRPIVRLPEGRMSIYDVDAQVLHSWEPTEAEYAMLDRNLAFVVRLGRGALAVAAHEARKCSGRWFDPRWKDPRTICHAHRKNMHGARITRRATKTGALEILDIDEGGNERVLATLAATVNVELIGSADDQLAYVIGRRLHVEELPSAERSTPRKLDVVDSLPCRSAPLDEDGCMIEHVRLLDDGSALVEVGTPYAANLYFVTVKSWRVGPLASLQKRKGQSLCTADTIHHGLDTRAVVQCEDDTPQWHVRRIGHDGAMTDAPASPAEMELARVRGEPPATLKLAGETVCAVDGLLYRGPACDAPRPRSGKR